MDEETVAQKDWAPSLRLHSTGHCAQNPSFRPQACASARGSLEPVSPLCKPSIHQTVFLIFKVGSCSHERPLAKMGVWTIEQGSLPALQIAAMGSLSFISLPGKWNDGNFLG